MRVERIVPAADDDFDPAFDVAGEFDENDSVSMASIPRKVGLIRERGGKGVHKGTRTWPRPLRKLMLLAQILRRHGIPTKSAIGAQLIPLGPPPATGIRPAFAVDGAGVHHHLLRPRAHDGTTHRHLLDLHPVGPPLIVLADLLVEVEILARLNRRPCWFFQCSDSVQPFDGAGTDVTEDDDADGRAVDEREFVTVHFPRQHHLVCFDFGPGDGDEVVHEGVLLEAVRVG